MADDDTRTQILAAALAILGEEDQHALTVRRVAARAGCSTIGVYTWFGSKDGLVDAILADGFASFGAALAQSRSARGRMGRMRGMANAYRTWALTHPAHYQVMFGKPDPTHIPSVEAASAAMRAYEALHGGVVEAQRKGDLSTTDVDAVALACWGMVHGLVMLQLANPKPPSLAEQADVDSRAFTLAVDMMAKGLGICRDC